MKGVFEKYQSTQERAFWHVLFWLGYIATYTLIYGSHARSFSDEFIWIVIYLPMKMAATYFILYYVLPRYFLKKRYVATAVLSVAAIIIASLLQFVLDLFISSDLLHSLKRGGATFLLTKVMKITLGVYPVVAFAAFVKLAKHWYEKENQAQELKHQKLEAELNFLKGQIHPHFLFNTLNNLYALTLKKSESAPEVVLKLSELLSFMLYECNSRTVALDKEMKLIENYISLEKIRYDERLTVHYSKEGDISGNEIPPMLLLPFVENAFKHGASDMLEEVVVEIKLSVEKSTLDFTVENTKTDGEYAEEMEYQKGIGLQNVRRRLELLYDGGYHLDIEDSDKLYRINLQLQLDQLMSNGNDK
ncbi:MAG: sensor histidine kinase [Balneolaceae bacterium]|nr:sensor histidine kinase [Balneolaceae bacterium]